MLASDDYAEAVRAYEQAAAGLEIRGADVPGGRGFVVPGAQPTDTLLQV